MSVLLNDSAFKKTEFKMAPKPNKTIKYDKLNAAKAIASIEDDLARDEIENFLVKTVGSYDLQGIRFVSLYNQVSELANMQTVYRDIIETNGFVRSTDFQIRWRENYMGFDQVQFFNLNGANPQEAAMQRGVRGNTMGAYGNTLNIRWITSALHEQSPIASGDERAEQLRMQLGRMKRFSNAALLSNTEQTLESGTNVPQWRGLVQGSTLNSQVISGDLTNSTIQAAVDTIANATSNQGLGYQVPLIALTTKAQISKIRDLMIARFVNAEFSMSYLDNQARLKAAFPNFPMPVEMAKYYQPDPGRAVVFLHEPQLPSGTTLFFDPTQIKIAKFNLMGQFGPWVVERPTEQLTDLLVVFDMESQVDALLESRYSISGVN